MALFSVEAIILKSSPFAERDKLLVLFAKEKGKISVIAKGARRPGSSFGGRCEILAHNNFLLAQGRNLNIVSQIETIHTFQKVRDKPEAFFGAAFLCRFLVQVLEEGQTHAALFVLLLECLHWLEEGGSPALVRVYFAARFAQAEGLLPVIDRCAHCGRKLKKKPIEICFSDTAGGIICEPCRQKIFAPRLVSFTMLEQVEQLAKAEIAAIAKREIALPALNQIEKFLAAYIGGHLELDLVAWKEQA